MEFVTDRTSADVDRVREYNRRGWNNLSDEEKAEWLAGMKGAFNYTDYNRIVDNVYQLEYELIKFWAHDEGVYRISDSRYFADVTNQFLVVVITEAGNTVTLQKYNGEEVISTETVISDGTPIIRGEYSRIRVNVTTDEETMPKPYVGTCQSQPELILRNYPMMTMQSVPRTTNFSNIIYDTNLLISNYAEDSGISPMPAFPTKPDYTYFNQLEDTHRQLHEYATSTE